MLYSFESDFKGIRKSLLAYYFKHARDLPWRGIQDPYAVWVSEIMLQQTQVKTVKPRYEMFLKQFPTVYALANAKETDVCEAWAGLGFYRRARNLHKSAILLVNEYDGKVPKSVKDLQRLPGIGRYTAGAIASIAYNQEAALVDGNVIRVFARLFGLVGRVDEPSLVKQVWLIAEILVSGKHPGDWNQAIMDLGAVLCTPFSPTCSLCPIQKFCVAFEEGNQSLYPAFAKQPVKQPLFIAFAWYKSSEGLLLQQRGLDGLWPGLWEMPSAQGETEEAALLLLRNKLCRPLKEEIGYVKHSLSHRNVTAKVYRMLQSRKIQLKDTMQMLQEPLKAPLSALAKKAIQKVLIN